MLGKERIKITAEDNEMDDRNKRSRINKAKSYFFKKIQWKSVKLSRFIQDKRKKHNVRNEKKGHNYRKSETWKIDYEIHLKI